MTVRRDKKGKTLGQILTGKRKEETPKELEARLKAQEEFFAQDPAVKNLKDMLMAMDDLLAAVKTQQELITLMAKHFDVTSRQLLAIAQAIQRLEAKP